MYVHICLVGDDLVMTLGGLRFRQPCCPSTFCFVRLLVMN